MSERTTKYVTGTFAVTYHGRYVSADQIPGDLMSILDAALEDRDDLHARWRPSSRTDPWLSSWPAWTLSRQPPRGRKRAGE